jgi:hypothetical protein
VKLNQKKIVKWQQKDYYPKTRILPVILDLVQLQRHPLPLVAIALRTPGGLMGNPEGMPGLMGKSGGMPGFPILAPLVLPNQK